MRIAGLPFFDIHFEFCKATEPQNNKPTKQQSSKAAKQQSISVIGNSKIDDRIWKILGF
jgi:hypothetical protein